MSEKSSSSRNSTKPVLPAVLNICCIIEVLLFAALLVGKVWIDNDWWINRLLLTNAVLFGTTLLFSFAAHSGKE